MAKVPYAKAIGCLMYLMVCTWSDISHAVSVVSLYMSNPSLAHLEALMWIFKYLNDTKDVGLMFKRSKSNYECLEGFEDADFGGNRYKRKSLTDYIFTA